MHQLHFRHRAIAPRCRQFCEIQVPGRRLTLGAGCSVGLQGHDSIVSCLKIVVGRFDKQ